jgi:argininosuccinate lyase
VWRFKASETLLGIETILINSAIALNKRFKASETLLGIETAVVHLAALI